MLSSPRLEYFHESASLLITVRVRSLVVFVALLGTFGLYLCDLVRECIGEAVEAELRLSISGAAYCAAVQTTHAEPEQLRVVTTQLRLVRCLSFACSNCIACTDTSGAANTISALEVDVRCVASHASTQHVFPHACTPG
eukprot:2839543-Pleurochrysis_carterae.AAC.1